MRLGSFELWVKKAQEYFELRAQEVLSFRTSPYPLQRGTAPILIVDGEWWIVKNSDEQ